MRYGPRGTSRPWVKTPASTTVQLTIYAGQLGLAMIGFSLG
jgi:hypothetical protein